MVPEGDQPPDEDEDPGFGSDEPRRRLVAAKSCWPPSTVRHPLLSLSNKARSAAQKGRKGAERESGGASTGQARHKLAARP